MESKGQGAHFSQEKEGESVTLKVRFAQFKETVGPSSSDGSGGSCLKWFNFVLSVILLVRVPIIMFYFSAYVISSLY